MNLPAKPDIPQEREQVLGIITCRPAIQGCFCGLLASGEYCYTCLIKSTLIQQLLDQARSDANKRTSTPCGYCGKPVDDVVTITPKYYCNHSHRTLAYNNRQKSKRDADQ